MKRLFQKWHWLHTWSPWKRNPVDYIKYAWTPPGHYAHRRQTQERTCSVCNKVQVELILNVR